MIIMTLISNPIVVHDYNMLQSTSIPLTSYLMWNRKLFDGLRRVLIIFVFRDHFFNTVSNNTTLQSDKFTFVILTGFVITLQSISFAESQVSILTKSANVIDCSKSSNNSNKRNAFHFLSILFER